MQTLRGEKSADMPVSSFISEISSNNNSTTRSKKYKIREFISWASCTGVVSLLTGLLLLLKVGVTMETVTTVLFYLSLAGTIYFLSRVLLLLKQPVNVSKAAHLLN